MKIYNLNKKFILISFIIFISILFYLSIKNSNKDVEPPKKAIFVMEIREGEFTLWRKKKCLYY